MADLDTAMRSTGSIPTAANIRRRNQGPARAQRKDQQTAETHQAYREATAERTTDCKGSYLYGAIRVKFNTNRVKFNTRAFLRRADVKFNIQVAGSC